MIDLNSLQHFHFLRPYWFIAFILFIIILRLFSRRDDTLAMWRKFMSTTMLNTLTVSGSNSNWLSPQKLSLLLSVPLCLVLMGPTWQQQPSPFSENNAALIIALDVSETMEQNDVQPSRLLRAKQKILALIDLRGDTKTALVAFAGSAHVVIPITDDREMIRHFLDVLTPNLMPVQGKLPESILPLAKTLLTPTEVPGTVLLIGDGATSESTEHFARFFDKQKHQLIVWAIGELPSNKQTEEQSSLIPLQISQLKELANAGNSRLVTMTHDNEDTVNVNKYIEHNLVIVDDESRPWYDSGYPLVFVIASIFLFWFRRGWTLQW